MPTLPSGRRVEFSLDRFSAMLENLPATDAACICDALIDPDDLMHVLDIVLFKSGQDEPYFAGQVLSHWTSIAGDWDADDRQSFYDYLGSSRARASRAEAIAALKESMNQPRRTDNNGAVDEAAQETLLQAA